MRALAAIAVSFAVCAAASAAETLLLSGSVGLPEVTGRFDHLAIDAKGRRLFMAALGNDTVEVIDVAARKRITTIKGVQKPAGLAFLAEQNQIAVGSGGDGKLKLFSGADYKRVAQVDSLDDADNVRFDAANGWVFVGYGEGALAKVDIHGWKKVGEFRVGAHPESFQLERGGGQIFVNVPGAKQIAVVSAAENRVRSFPMEKFQANFPMALDEANHRLFVGCRRPARLVILSTEDGKEIGNTDISEDTDDLFYDAKRKRVYVSCGEGFIDVIDCGAPVTPRRIEKVATRPGARTSLFSAELDRLFLAVPRHGGEPAELRIYDAKE